MITEQKPVPVSVNQPQKGAEIEYRQSQSMPAPRKVPTIYKGFPIDYHPHALADGFIVCPHFGLEIGNVTNTFYP
jgi:hypothetical protein